MDFKKALGWGLEAGMVAPDFSLLGTDKRFHSLSEYRGKNVFLYFFPRAFSSRATQQALSLKSYHHILKQNYILLGISTDPLNALQAFAEHHSLLYPLFSDVTQKVSKNYNVLNPFQRSSRVTFFIGKDGVIKKVFRFVPPKYYSQTLLEECRYSHDLSRSPYR
ncbi:MAG: redoxin domain-containing protein [bacterium]